MRKNDAKRFSEALNEAFKMNNKCLRDENIRLSSEKEKAVKACRKYREIIRQLQKELDWRKENLNEMISNAAEADENERSIMKKYIDLQNVLTTYAESNAMLAGKLSAYENVKSGKVRID